MIKMIRKISIVLFLSFIVACSSKKENDFLRLPVVGIIQNNEVPILIKTISEGKVRIEYKKNDESPSAFTKWQTLTKTNLLTSNLFLSNLDYSTDYKYRVEFDEGNYSKWFVFKTLPKQGEPGIFNFVFSACLRQKYMGYDIFTQIKSHNPNFVALLGDQMYADYDGNVNILESYLSNDSLREALALKEEMILDDKTVLDAFRSKYSRVYYKEGFQNMASSIPLLAIWDDHDYGEDNSDKTYRYKDEAKIAFKENFPQYPFEQNDEGIYYKIKIADVDIFVLDTRWYRSRMDEEDGKNKTMLGDKQLHWLFDGIKNSNSKFKIIISSVSMNDYGGDTSSDKDGIDNWKGYKFERNKILSLINDKNIKGVLVFSGDQHYPSAHILNWKRPLIPLSRNDKSIEYSLSNLGNAVFDFSASPLSYKTATGTALRISDQENPLISYEVYRPEWGKPENDKNDGKINLASVFGAAEIDTKSVPAKVTMKFFEYDKNTLAMMETYKIIISE
ncbi:MAG: alkaline phosphatase D family protein [Labilibaculum sp.]|nr:alkaline phosphatase D family protein [Labilibaculum sp.]MBI9060167.1 alkaline phosphatase D family protein [Labilibaculum sp.]